MLFHASQPGRVLGVLDWELSTLGHPLADLAYTAMAYRLPSGSLPEGSPSLPQPLPAGETLVQCCKEPDTGTCSTSPSLPCSSLPSAPLCCRTASPCLRGLQRVLQALGVQPPCIPFDARLTCRQASDTRLLHSQASPARPSLCSCTAESGASSHQTLTTGPSSWHWASSASLPSSQEWVLEHAKATPRLPELPRYCSLLALSEWV